MFIAMVPVYGMDAARTRHGHTHKTEVLDMLSILKYQGS